MSPRFGGVIKGWKLDLTAVAVAEREVDECIGEGGILRQDGAVEVGANRVAVARAFRTV